MVAGTFSEDQLKKACDKLATDYVKVLDKDFDGQVDLEES